MGTPPIMGAYGNSEPPETEGPEVPGEPEVTGVTSSTPGSSAPVGLVRFGSPGALVALAPTVEAAEAFAANAKAENTRRAYRSDWADFTAWCEARGLPSLPASPDTVALYVSDLASVGRKVSTIQRRLSSISQAHQLAGHDPSPTASSRVRTVFAGIRRTLGAAQTGKAAAVVEDVRAMVAKLPETTIGVRDRALLLVGFGGAFRRSELVALVVEDVEFVRNGLAITIRRSKTDQAGVGRKLGIPFGSKPATCAARSLRAWLDAAAITTGPLFRAVDRHGHVAREALTGRAVADIVKRSAERAGLDPTRYAGHSLRAGLATSAAAAGASERSIMNQTGHKSTTMVRRYIRDGSLFRENAAGSVGL
jgi:site-specific recombinase XerD